MKNSGSCGISFRGVEGALPGTDGSGEAGHIETAVVKFVIFFLGALHFVPRENRELGRVHAGVGTEDAKW